MKDRYTVDCEVCGTCCIAYDITVLNKKAGERCKFLQDDNRCGDYDNRPAVCRAFKQDAFCVLISTLPQEDQVKIVRKVYDI